MHVLSSMTPTCVFSSSETTGTLNAFGSRARQFDLFWSSNVYSTFTISTFRLDADFHEETTSLPRIDRRGMSLMLFSSAAAGAGVGCMAPLSAGVLMGVDMAGHGLSCRDRRAVSWR
jgi:hypothetical protein